MKGGYIKMSNTIITTVSMSKEESAIVEEFGLKPSKLLQEAINLYAEREKPHKKEMETLHQNIKNLNAWLKVCYEMLGEKGIEFKQIAERKNKQDGLN